MYRFLDRQPSDLDEHQHFLTGAMRQWTAAARAGRCPCAALAPGFGWRGVMAALPDFTKLMALLDAHALRWLRFGVPGAERVTEAEATLLGLFDAALGGQGAAVRRIAATLVGDAVPAVSEELARAAEWVALRFVQVPLARRD